MSEEEEQPMSDEQAIFKIAQAMKDVPTGDEKHNVHSFLVNAIKETEVEKVSKVGNLRDDKDLNELGNPRWTVRGCLEMSRISDKLMGNKFFKDYFDSSIKETLSTSLSREGFLIRQATTQTKQVADITKRKKTNKGMFGSKKIEESGGDTIVSSDRG